MLTIKNINKIKLRSIPNHKAWFVENVAEGFGWNPQTNVHKQHYTIRIKNHIYKQDELIILCRELEDGGYKMYCIRGGKTHWHILRKDQIKNMGTVLNYIKLVGIEFV